MTKPILARSGLQNPVAFKMGCHQCLLLRKICIPFLSRLYMLFRWAAQHGSIELAELLVKEHKCDCDFLDTQTGL